MKKRLTEAEFQGCVKGLDVGQQTLDIAYGVLVKNQPQADFATALGLSRGAVSQSVNRVWTAHIAKNLPQGFVRVSAVLPERQAFIVNKWVEQANKRVAKQ